MTTLTCDNIRQIVFSGATLLDVRNKTEFNCGALPNAKNIPLAILPVLAEERLGKNDTVLVYCRAGGRAVIAEKILSSLGFTNVKSIGGIHQFQHCC